MQRVAERVTKVALVVSRLSLSEETKECFRALGKSFETCVTIVQTQLAAKNLRMQVSSKSVEFSFIHGVLNLCRNTWIGKLREKILRRVAFACFLLLFFFFFFF